MHNTSTHNMWLHGPPIIQCRYNHHCMYIFLLQLVFLHFHPWQTRAIIQPTTSNYYIVLPFYCIKIQCVCVTAYIQYKLIQNVRSKQLWLTWHNKQQTIYGRLSIIYICRAVHLLTYLNILLTFRLPISITLWIVMIPLCSHLQHLMPYDIITTIQYKTTICHM